MPIYWYHKSISEYIEVKTMKKILALILVITMALSYTVFAEEDVFEDEFFEDFYEEEIPEETYDEYEENSAFDSVEKDPEGEYIDEYIDESEVQKKPISDEETTNSSVKVYVNNRRILFDAEPMLVNSRTMVPVRAIFEALGATVTWDNDTQTAIGVLDNTTIKIKIGQAYLLKNDEVVELDSPALLSSSRTYVPVRAIAESYDCTVDWVETTQSVYITSK